MAIDDQLITNADIADAVGARVPFVRDVLDDYFDTTSCNATSVPKWDFGSSQSDAVENDTIKNSNIKDIPTINGNPSDNPITDSNCEYRPEHLFTCLPDPVVETEFWGKEPVIRRVNDAFEDIFGYDNVVGEPLRELIIPEECQDVKERSHKCQSKEDAGRIVNRTTSNGVRSFLHRHLPYEHGDDQYAFEVYVDMGDLQYQSAKIDQRNEQIKMWRKQSKQFNSLLMNEFQPKIYSVIKHLNQISEQEDNMQNSDIELGLKHLQQLIDRTIDLNENSKLVTKTNQVSIEMLAKSAWGLIDTDGSNLCISNKFKLHCDSDRCLQLLLNIFRNAIQHNDSPVTVQIDVHNEIQTSTRSDTQNAFYIADNGRGIPDNKKSEVFELGHTESEQSTGLGMTIVQRIVEAHQWKIDLAESSNGGCKFIISDVDIC